MLLQIALRNLFRNRRRTGMALGVICIGVVSLLLTLGFVRYSFDGLRLAIINGGLAHLQISSGGESTVSNPLPGWSGGPPDFQNWQEIRTKVRTLDGIRAVGPVIQLAGILMNGDQSAAFTATALEPEQQRRMGIDVRLRGGSNLSDGIPSRGEEEVLIGVSLARALSVEPGDIVVAMVGTVTGSLNATDLRVAGVFTTGLQALDTSIAQMHLSTAQWLLGSDEVSALLVSLNDGFSAEQTAIRVRSQLESEHQDLTILTWEARAPFYHQVRNLYIGIFVFLGTIIGLLVSLATSNTFQMSVIERMREFGALLAMGTDRMQLARLVMLEALWLAFAGGLFGNVLALFVSWVINLLQIEMPPPPGAVDPINLSVLLQPTDFILSVLVMAALLLVASAPPIYRIMRMRVVDALGYI